MIRVVFGSTNPSKFERMRALLELVGVELLDGSDVAVADLTEGSTVQGNAEVKALAYAVATSKPAIATDYGLSIAGLRDEDQPNAFVRRVMADRAAADDLTLLEHYRRVIERLGGSAEGTWTGAMALACNPGDVVSVIARTTRRWVDRPSKALRPGEPLASLQIDPATGTYVSEIEVEDRASKPNEIDQTFLEFIAAHTARLASLV